MKIFILRSVAGFLLCCMLLHTTGFFIVLQVHKFQMRKATRQMLSQDPSNRLLTHFSFSPKDYDQLEWEDDDEFLFEGHMYDVVSKKKNGELWQISCVKDEKEQSLAKLYYQHMEKDGPKKMKRSIPLWTWLYLPGYASISLQPNYTLQSYIVQPDTILPHFFPEMIKPPPQSRFA